MAAIATVFLFGLATTVYLSLLSPEVTVPDVLGKDRFEAETILEKAGLNFRVRATRPSNQVKADTVLFQLPRAGEVVKAGQTVAMDISRATKEGESSQILTAPTPDQKADTRSSETNTNANENRAKRSKAVNKNQNDNENGNTNTNRGSEVNRPRVVNSNSNTTRNQNSEAANQNEKRRDATSSEESGNVNRRPASRPSPSSPRNDNREDF